MYFHNPKRVTQLNSQRLGVVRHHNGDVMLILRIAIILIVLIPSCSKDTVGHVTSFDGVTIEYEMHGKGNQSLVFIHGWCCDRTYWAQQISHFSKSYHVISIDLAGHGGSSRNRTEWSMNAYGEDIASVINNTNAKEIVLIGHSAGAFAALAGAVLLQDRTVGIIGADGFRFSKPDYLERRYSEQKLQEIEDSFGDDFAADMKEAVTRWFLPQSDTNLVNWVAKDMGEAPRDVAIPAALAYVKYLNGDLQKDLRTMGNKIPIVEIRAGDKGKVALEHVREYAPLFEVVYQYGVGHFLMMEDPNTFNGLLEKQLKQIF